MDLAFLGYSVCKKKKKSPALLKHLARRWVLDLGGLLLYPFLFQGNRVQGLGHARQELHSQTACGPSRVFSSGLGRGCWETRRLFHTQSPTQFGSHLQLQTRTGRGSTLAMSDVAGEKKNQQLPFHPLPDKQAMPIICPAFGHIKQNLSLGKVFGYVASRGADRRGGGLTYFSPLVRSVTCRESPRTAHSLHPGRG